MDDPERGESKAVGFVQVLLHDGLHIARGYGVEIEDIGDGDADGFVFQEASALPLSQQSPDEHQLPEVVGVVVGDQERFPQ
jgi:hypothetical protein